MYFSTRHLLPLHEPAQTKDVCMNITVHTYYITHDAPQLNCYFLTINELIRLLLATGGGYRRGLQDGATGGGLQEGATGGGYRRGLQEGATGGGYRRGL